MIIIQYIIVYIVINIITYLALKIIKKFLLYYNREISIKRFFIPLYVITTIIFIIYKVAINYRNEFFHISSRSYIIFLIMFSLTSIISFSVAILYLKIFKQKIGTEIKEKNIESSNKDKKIDKEEIIYTRREFIKKGAFVFPIGATLFSVVGISEGFEDSIIRKMGLKYKNLPKEFEGLKIAQISDLHLGHFIRVSHLKKIINNLIKEKIDLLLITGDFVDDYTLLKGAIKELKRVNPTYGIYSSAGNHEYFRGIKPVLKAFKEENIPYLISEGRSIDINGKNLFIGGVDDPRRLAGDINKFMDNSIMKAIENSNKDDFKILMSHRPTAFLVASQKNIELTLSGHTHGAQIGFNGRSLFESFQKNGFLWGHYQKGESQLYTTSGAGHWFPFRISCPTEVPIFILES